MRKADFQRNHEEFEKWIVTYAGLLRKLIPARKVILDRNQEQELAKTEKAELVEALVIQCAARWEVLVESDIIASLNRDTSEYAANLGLRIRRHLSRDEIEAMVIGRQYLDFRSVGDIKSFGRRFLVPNLNPFQAISKDHAKRIDEFMCIRNLLAHRSSYARRAYRRMTQEHFGYTNIPEPAAFLCVVNPRPVKLDVLSRTYRWTDYLDTFLTCSMAMQKHIARGIRQTRA